MVLIRESNRVSFLLGVCVVQSVWFFLKFVTESIMIGFLIIKTDAYQLGSVFLTYSGAVWSARFNQFDRFKTLKILFFFFLLKKNVQPI